MTSRRKARRYVDRDTTPDDLPALDEPELYRNEDGSVGPLFTPEELKNLGRNFEKPLTIPPSPDR